MQINCKEIKKLNKSGLYNLEFFNRCCRSRKKNLEVCHENNKSKKK